MDDERGTVAPGEVLSALLEGYSSGGGGGPSTPSRTPTRCSRRSTPIAGMLESRNYEFPGRYTQRLRGFVDPPLAVVSRDRVVRVEALNARGEVLLPAVRRTLERLAAVERLVVEPVALEAHVRLPAERFPEEARSKQDTVFSVLRALLELFRIDRDEDDQLGLYGAFGYDLVFQFENIDREVERDLTQRDMVLYLPDTLFVAAHGDRTGRLITYEFEVDGVSTAGLERTGSSIPYTAATTVERTRDHQPGGFADDRPQGQGVVPGAATCSRWSAGRRSSPRAPMRRRSSSTGCANATPPRTAC